MHVRNRIGAVAKIATFVFLIAGSLGGPARAAEKFILQLDWLPSGDKAPAYVGVHDGFFAAEGLDVTIQNSRGSIDALTRTAAGSADFATGGLPALMSADAQSTMPVKAVFSIYSKPPDSLFVIKGGPIKTLRDAIGHKVGTATFTSSNTLWPLVLHKNHIDPKAITLVKVDPSVLGPMLAQGKVDATISWMTQAPYIQALLDQSGKQLAVIPWSRYGLDGYGFSLFASERVIRSNPQAVARFVRAFKKAILFSIANPAAAGEAVHAIAPMVNPHIAAAAFRAGIPLIKNEISAKYGLGTFDPALLKQTWEWVAQSEGYPVSKLDPATVVDRAFIPAVEAGK